MPPPPRARARAVGLVTGPHARTPCTHSQWVVGPGRTPERTRGRGWDCTRPRTPHTQAGGAPPGHPHAAATARKGARCGVGDGSQHRQPPHPQPVGSGPRPHARTDERSGVGERPSPDASHPGKRPPPGHPHAAPTARKSARCGVGDGSPRPHTQHPQPVGSGAHTHTRAHSTWPASPGSPPRGRAAGGGGAPDPRCPSQRRTAPPPGTPYRHPHGAQRQPARARAVGPVLGPHARTDRTRDTAVAEPWLPDPENGRPGEGQRLTPDAFNNSGKPSPPPGRPSTTPAARSYHRACRPRGQCWVPTPTHPHTARGWRTPTARPVGGQSGKGQRLTSDAPHNGGRHPPRAPPSATPTASNAGPQGRTLWGRCWVPTPAPTAPGTHGSRNPAYPLQRTDGRGRDSA